MTAELGRLSARPVRPAPATPDPSGEPPEPGLHELGLRDGTGRDGLLYVPHRYQGGVQVPLAVMLHGAGSNARRGLDLLLALADAANVLVVAPDSRGPTWDVIRGGYGPDVAFIDKALAVIFERFDIDPGKVAIGGFSDGASYGLSLGVGNGDVFTHVVAFSPGFLAPPEPQGRPRIFATHGVDDPVLPIDVCSRRLVPLLKGAGYHVDYHEFDGGHIVPPVLAKQAVEWLLAAP